MRTELRKKDENFLIFSSSLGTIFEWYDFYVYGSFTLIIAEQFFSGLNATSAYVFSLLSFAVGFLARPFGSLFFGKIGDTVGRKKTFLVTISIMGASTFLIGLLPTYKHIGIWAPILLISLRILQGFSIGGEYGGAITYVAEHTSKDRRNLKLAFLQIGAPFGFCLALFISFTIEKLFSKDNFQIWGWRLPFLFSLVLLIISLYLRLKLEESPIFKKIHEKGDILKNPVLESIFKWKNLNIILRALALTAGNGAIYYASIFYIGMFLVKFIHLDKTNVDFYVFLSLLLSVPWIFFIAYLCDKFGCKILLMLGFFLGMFLIPVYKQAVFYANPQLYELQKNNKVLIHANKTDCKFNFNLTTKAEHTSCDFLKEFLSSNGINYELKLSDQEKLASISINDNNIDVFAGLFLEYSKLNKLGEATINEQIKKEVGLKLWQELEKLGYSKKADESKVNKFMLVVLIYYLALVGYLTYVPLSNMLLEMFQANLRYTGVSIPYHFGIGIFGGLAPVIIFSIITSTGNVYNGMWYPFIVAIISLSVCFFFVRGGKNKDIDF